MDSLPKSTNTMTMGELLIGIQHVQMSIAADRQHETGVKTIYYILYTIYYNYTVYYILYTIYIYDICIYIVCSI